MSKIVVGLSGGVDSAVTAYLLKQQGNDCIGVTLKLWPTEDASCEDARKVCEKIGIEHVVVDFSEDFQNKVVDYFVSEYISGRTPNPCCICNKEIKFKKLLEWANANGYEKIATGHYAKVFVSTEGRYCVEKAVSDKKDQTYALFELTQEELSKVVMPLGDYDKEEIRRIALEAELPVAAKADSQDICFIPDGDYASFLRQYAKQNPKSSYLIPSPGNFVDESGKILGKHTGYTDYTIGQRRGLNISAGHRIFVKEIRPKTNEVVISDTDIYSDSLSVSSMNCMLVPEIDKDIRLFAKIRYAHKGEWCILSPSKKTGVYICKFEKPVRAITPGQAIVFYDNDSDVRKIVCGGIINGNQS